MKTMLFCMMRRESVRLPNKLASKIWTPIGFVSLMEWAAYRVKAMAGEFKTGYLLGVSAADAEWLGGEFACVVRSPESLAAETVQGLQADLPPRLDGFDWALHINACCPFLETRTVLEFMEAAATQFTPAAGMGIQPAIRDSGFVYAGGARIFPGEGPGVVLDTKTNAGFFVPCHAFSLSPASKVGRDRIPTGGYVSVGARRPEFLDVDEPADLDLVAAYASYKWRRIMSPSVPQVVAQGERYAGYP